MDLPEAVEVSVLNLKEPGERVTLADATLPSGVEFVEHDDGHAEVEGEEKPKVTDQMVASVWEPSAIAAANEAAAGDAEEADAENVEAENGDDTSQEKTDESQSSGDKDSKE